MRKCFNIFKSHAIHLHAVSYNQKCFNVFILSSKSKIRSLFRFLEHILTFERDLLPRGGGSGQSCSLVVLGWQLRKIKTEKHGVENTIVQIRHNHISIHGPIHLSSIGFGNGEDFFFPPGYGRFFAIFCDYLFFPL